MLQNLDYGPFIGDLVGGEVAGVAGLDIDAVEGAHGHVNDVLGVEADAQQVVVELVANGLEGLGVPVDDVHLVDCDDDGLHTQGLNDVGVLLGLAAAHEGGVEVGHVDY